ncbi:ThiF family adenylyltransferase [[Haemophilus] felis]|uniref:Thiamine/molybdopterin biosynthesis protein n=1 Tax=[Haemophilus] felis TaxID=123822 RepID=A0A1T0AW79_9PAST|nr:ThiF family adenylyltransferase [[Haemophilus] felis]NBI41253.1 ThiF family adenylyltransferase [[Haemophilus] felis]NBI43685.1 ThiF family adenylyltransferase [[Haemophilus] felis]OOS01763.1 thiamine/molybdopterin biosynthesis protein [[Haemophilus] felis]
MKNYRWMEISPKIKKAYPVVFTEGKVYVGGFGKITEYDDQYGFVKSIFEMIDGVNSISEITEKMLYKHNALTKGDILEFINDLNEEGFIEDNALIGSDVLDDYEMSRYHRNINFFSSFLKLDQNKFSIQKKISDSRIGILGLGGLGSHIVYDLAGLGVGKIKAIEFDQVELSNLNRQILYNFNDVGKDKAELAKKRINEFNPKVDFEYKKIMVSSSQDIEDFFHDVDLLILVADRPKTKLANWVNEAICKLGIPLFCAGLEAQRAMHYTVIPGQTGCIACWRKQVEMDSPVSDLILKKKTELNLVGDNTAIVPLVSTITGFICVEIVKYLTGIGQMQSVGKLISIDFNTMKVVEAETWSKQNGCEVCGKNG